MRVYTENSTERLVQAEAVTHGEGYDGGDRPDLVGADLVAANLSGANLSGAHLSEANLSEADLSEADLSGANLSEAVLVAAVLSGANLRDADLVGANLRDADLSDADLSGADLREANLSGADLSGAVTINGSILAHCSISASTHGECGRMLTGVRHAERDAPDLFWCGCFHGNENSLREYIANGDASLADIRITALNCVLSMLDINGGVR